MREGRGFACPSPSTIVDGEFRAEDFIAYLTGRTHDTRAKLWTPGHETKSELPGRSLRQHAGAPVHENAYGAAEAALAAHAQRKFWELHDLLFTHQVTLTRACLETLAKAAGLNLVGFRKALDTKMRLASKLPLPRSTKPWRRV